MSESSRIEDLGLRAVWDGVEDHAVQVNLSIRVCFPSVVFLL